MSISGDIKINIDSLKRYVNSFDISKIKNVDIGGYNLEINSELKKTLQVSLDLINEIKEENDWIKCQMSLTQLFYNVFFKIDNISIKIGDFYECLIEASNLKTYKNLIKGFGDFLDIGSIVIVDSDGNTIATIGKKSDFIFEILYQNFINDYHEHL